jgi:hypothetical protein
MTNIVDGFITSKHFVPGFGYSPSSGQNIGAAVQANPSIYSSTFFGTDLKSLFPSGKFSFSKKKKKIIKGSKRSKRSKRSKGSKGSKGSKRSKRSKGSRT